MADSQETTRHSSQEEYQLRSGFLFKKPERGVTGWKKRFCVLTETKLSYYKRGNSTPASTEPPGELKGTILINSDCEVSDASHRTGTETQFTFFAKDREYAFKANDRAEAHQWIDLLKKVIEESKRKKQCLSAPERLSFPTENVIFGVLLSHAVNREKKGDYHIPSLLQMIMDWLEDHALQTPGIFRLSGSHADVRSLIEQLEQNEIKSIPETTDPHAVANMLKQYFRDLPTCIFPSNLYPAYLVCEQKLTEKEMKIMALRKLNQRLPKCHRWLLYKTFELMEKFNKHEEVTHMTVSNIAIVLCPNFFQAPPSVCLVQSIKDTPFFLSLTKLFLENYRIIFEEEEAYAQQNPVVKKTTSKALTRNISSPSSRRQKIEVNAKLFFRSSTPEPEPRPVLSGSDFALREGNKVNLRGRRRAATRADEEEEEEKDSARVCVPAHSQPHTLNIESAPLPPPLSPPPVMQSPPPSSSSSSSNSSSSSKTSSLAEAFNPIRSFLTTSKSSAASAKPNKPTAPPPRSPSKPPGLPPPRSPSPPLQALSTGSLRSPRRGMRFDRSLQGEITTMIGEASKPMPLGNVSLLDRTEPLNRAEDWEL